MEKYKLSGKQKDILVMVLFAVVSLLFLIPFLSNISNLGIGDWDLHFSYSGVPAEAITQYHQFPLWNPYICGGGPSLAHPESSFLSPFFIFIILLGEVVGLKILVLIHLFLGMAGMYLLSRYLSIGREGSVFSSIIFMLSTHYSIHIVAGHTTDYMPMAFMPFAFLFYLMAIDKKIEETGKKTLKKRFLYATASSSFILLMFLSGAVYSLAFFAMFLISYSFFESILRKNIRPIMTCLAILIMAAIFSSVKLVPMLGFLMHNNTDYGADWEANSPKILFSSLFSREQGYYSDNGTDYGWWEYSTYIGMIPFAVFLLGAIFRFRKRGSLMLSIIPFMLFYFGNLLPINFWGIIHDMPLLSFFRVPSRNLLIVLFCLAIISGDGIDAIKNFINSIRIKHELKNSFVYSAISLIIAIVVIDLFMVNWPNLLIAFPFKNPDFGQSTIFESTNSKFSGIVNYNGRSYSYVYLAFLSNKGALNDVDCWEERVFVPTIGSALPKESSGYKDEAYLEYGKGMISKIYFSPNKIVAEVNAADSDRLMLNQNYYPGWRSRIDGRKGKAEPHRNLVSVPINPGHHKIELYYLPDTLIIGILLEIAAIIAWLVAFLYISRPEGEK
ncbi:hypothetical protein COV19_04125 [Candidatus Woesearchaeota archaeon CG10_big_fil_rev_8_21_14_0_10_44_13]|nr:MAG: hypothetical protein COV19_04125 [Candidatus Woesearchaeota archaeon CG10_big_fil_rev_8_21_14_0_10_44_13]